MEEVQRNVLMGKGQRGNQAAEGGRGEGKRKRREVGRQQRRGTENDGRQQRKGAGNDGRQQKEETENGGR